MLKGVDRGRTGAAQPWVRRVWIVQALYFLVTGIWPLIGMRSFQAVTGQKVDTWLVQTVGVLTAVIGAVLAAAGLRQRVSAEMVGLAVGSSAGLATIDVVYVARKRIGRIYLADALLNILLCVGWAIAGSRRAMPQAR